MNFTAATLLFFLTTAMQTAVAGEQTIAFKEPVNFKPAYVAVVIILLIISLLIARKNNRSKSHGSNCRLVDKKYLGNKTLVYVIEYQQQRFLLASNPQALAIHQLNNENIDV